MLTGKDSNVLTGKAFKIFLKFLKPLGLGIAKNPRMCLSI